MTQRFQQNRVCKIFHFSAAHQLPHVSANHPCARLHGHNYKVEVIFEGECNPSKGWVIDFGEIKRVWAERIESVLDHRMLNDIPGLENPTAENLAHWIVNHWPVAMQMTIRVWETESCWAEAKYAWRSRTDKPLGMYHYDQVPDSTDVKSSNE